jgi:hypothetical protein
VPTPSCHDGLCCGVHNVPVDGCRCGIAAAGRIEGLYGGGRLPVYKSVLSPSCHDGLCCRVHNVPVDGGGCGITTAGRLEGLNGGGRLPVYESVCSHLVVMMACVVVSTMFLKMEAAAVLPRRPR